MATSSPRANTSPKSWFLPSSHPQPTPSTEDLCPLLGPEPPPRRPSRPSTASALAPARPVPAVRHHCSTLGYSVSIMSCGVTWASHGTAKSFRQREENNHYCCKKKIFPCIPFLSKTSVYSAWGRASPVDGAGLHTSTCPRQQQLEGGRKRRRKPFPTPTPQQLRTVQALRLLLGDQPLWGGHNCPLPSPKQPLGLTLLRFSLNAKCSFCSFLSKDILAPGCCPVGSSSRDSQALP